MSTHLQSPAGLTDGHGPLVPEMARIPVAMQITGMSRSGIYREASVGNIRLVKLGRTTLVDMASLRAFLGNLPTANIRTAA